MGPISPTSKEDQDLKKVITVTQNYRRESTDAKKDRMDQNAQNSDAYHLKQDFSHKRPGQSREFLPKQAMAIEQIVTFFTQALTDVSDWFRVEQEPGHKKGVFSEGEIYKLTDRNLKRAQFMTLMADAIKSGLIGSLMIAKVHGKHATRPSFVAESETTDGKVKHKLKRIDKTAWQLAIDLIRQEDYHVDPTGKKLYEMQDIYMDFHEVKALSEGENPLYDPKEVESLSRNMVEDQVQREKRAREQGQNVVLTNYRKQVKVTECYGTILDPGTGEVLFKNVMWTVGDDRVLLQKPTQNPFWHGRSPFVTAPIIRVPHSVWHKALMDAATKLNISVNELFNLILDGGIMSVFGIRQVRKDWMENEAEISKGIVPGQTIQANGSVPVGGKVLERVDTGSVPPEALNVFNLAQAEFHTSAMTNDLRMGVMPSRSVKATEVVEANQTITSVFSGVVKVIEESFVEQILDLAWQVCCQNMDDMDSEEIKAILGEERALALAALSPEQRFAASAMGHKFKVFGVSQTLNKMKDFRKLTGLLQTIGSSEVLIEEFLKKYDFGKLLSEIMRSLDINTDRLTLPLEEQSVPMMGSAVKGPNMQSQIPQASAGSLEEDVRSRLPRSEFPPSRATSGVSE